MWKIEAKAIRKLGSKRHFPWLRELLTSCEFYCTPVRRSPAIITPNNKDANVFHIFDCWKLYCDCGKRVQFREAGKVGNRFCDVFYCQNCGRIYELQKGKLKLIPWYRLKEYASKSYLGKSNTVGCNIKDQIYVNYKTCVLLFGVSWCWELLGVD